MPMLIISRRLTEAVVVQTPDPITVTVVQIDPHHRTATLDVTGGGESPRGFTLACQQSAALTPGVSVTLMSAATNRARLGFACPRTLRVDRYEVAVDRGEQPR